MDECRWEDEDGSEPKPETAFCVNCGDKLPLKNLETGLCDDCQENLSDD